MGTDPDGRPPGALARYPVTTDPAIGSHAPLSKDAPQHATRHCRELGIDALVPFYANSTTRRSATPIWVMLPAVKPTIDVASDTTSSLDEPAAVVASEIAAPGDGAELTSDKVNPVPHDEVATVPPVMPEPGRFASDQHVHPSPEGETPDHELSPLSQETTPDHHDGDNAASPTASVPKEDGDGTLRPAAND